MTQHELVTISDLLVLVVSGSEPVIVILFCIFLYNYFAVNVWLFLDCLLNDIHFSIDRYLFLKHIFCTFA